MITRYLLLLTLLSGWNTIIAQCLRDATLIDYQDNFIGSQVNLTELNWTGSVMDTICQPGTISSMAYERTLQRINYYRRLVGLPDSIRWDEVMSDKAQQAAVMMLANHDLSHDPPKTWKCWTQDGYDAARKSNLAFGTQSSESIRAYIQDNGSNNEAVGHRRWILYSRAKSFGMGSTKSTQALWVIGPKNPDPEVEFIAYPSQGFFPKPLVYNRWSFSKPNANFSQATIKMTDAFHQDIPLKILPVTNGYGDNTIVWEPEIPLDWLTGPYDEPITVTVSEVKIGGVLREFTYTVQLIPVLGSQRCRPGLKLDPDLCQCTTEQVTARPAWEQSIRVYPNPFGESITVSGIPEGTFVDVISQEGRLLLRRQLDGSRLDMRLLTNGIYFLRIYGEQATQVVKMLKTSGGR